MIELPHFILKEYHSKNVRDQNQLNQLKKDEKINHYVGEILEDEEINDVIYFVYKEDHFIGFITILDSIDHVKQLAYGILPEYRNHKYSILLLNEFSDYLLEIKKQYELLHLWFEKDNLPSITAAKHCGYQKETDYLYIKRKKEK